MIYTLNGEVKMGWGVATVSQLEFFLGALKIVKVRFDLKT